MEDIKIQILRDPTLNKLFSENFDSELFTLELLRDNSPSEFSSNYSQLTNLKQNLLNSFNSQITENYKTICENLKDFKNFEINLNLKPDLNQLTHNVNHLNTGFIKRYELLLSKLPKLENALKAQSLCKTSLKFIKNLKLLKTFVVIQGNSNVEILDLNKASKILKELLKIAKTDDLNDLKFFENEKEFIGIVFNTILSKNKKRLEFNLIENNKTEIINSFNVYENLEVLGEVIEKMANEYLKNCMNEWRICLTKEYEKSSIFTCFFKEISNVFQNSLEKTKQIWLIDYCLSFKEIENGKSNKMENIFLLFWQKEIHIIGQSFQKIMHNSSKFQLNYLTLVKGSFN